MTDAALMVELGLDATKVKKGIGELKTILKDLDKQRALSTSEKDLEILNRKIKIVQDQINRIKGFGFEEASKKIEDGSKKARTAITSLSLAVQDLPFGFIGIQNNLPGIIQGFGNLSSETKKLGGFTTVLKEQLKGPAGIFLAFSAVTSIITILVQKYGSLSGAFDAIINNSKILTKDQKDFAKSLADESSQIITLTTLYPKFENDRKKQVEIIQKLNQLSPKYFGNLKEEKTSIDEITASLDKYINSFVGKIYVESQQKRINELFTKYAEQITRVVDKEKDRINTINTTRSNIQGLEKDNNKYFKSVIENVKKVPTGDIAVGIQITPTKTTIQDAIDNLKSELKNQLTNVFGEIDIFKKFINIDDQFKTKEPKNLKEEIRNLKFEVEDLNNAFSFEEQAKKAEELSQVLLNQDQIIKNGIPGAKSYSYTLDERKKALEDLKKLSPDYFRNLNIEKTSFDDLSTAAFTYIRTLQNLRDEQISRQKASDLQIQADENTQKALEKKNAALEKEFDNIVKVTMANDLMSAQMRKISKINLDAVTDYKDMINQVSILTDYYRKLDKQQLKTGKFIEQYLKNPLEELFNVVLSKGENKWKDFADSVIKQLKRIAAQELATALGALIANIIAPGSGAAVKSALRGISTPGLGDWLSETPGSANFGSINGGLGLSGQVVFVQRGSDLVGVLNRTNATINRVG